jgi:hypothetical protein
MKQPLEVPLGVFPARFRVGGIMMRAAMAVWEGTAHFKAALLTAAPAKKLLPLRFLAGAEFLIEPLEVGTPLGLV